MLDGAMSIDISRPWARASSHGEPRAGGFFTVTNKAAEVDRLIGAASPAATKIEIQGIKVVGAFITMKTLEQGLRLPPDTAITLRPRGYHLLMDLTGPLTQGQRVPVTLTFEKAGTRQVELVVEAPGPISQQAISEG
jgi:copper(I)-binding protein